MFHKFNTVAYDSVCNDGGPQDLLRRVPCPSGQLCPDEDNPKNVFKNFQFNFRVEDLSQPRFWYISLVSCYRDKSTNCSWKAFHDENIQLNYDIWLVNGNEFLHTNNFIGFLFII